jgi:Ran GTPase-activating protein (RanGAP) involved in mRNA processing and transport
LAEERAVATLIPKDNKIGDSGTQALGAALKVTSTLTRLDLKDCGITVAGATHLAEGVGKCESLATIDLLGNEVGDSGVLTLGVALAATSTLTSLNLGGCGITASVAANLAEGVRKSVSIAMLSLPSNNFGNSGTQAIGVALTVTSTITHLNLSSCGITAADAAHLAEGVGKCGSLTTLNLWVNNLGNSGTQTLVAALKVTSTLTSLDLKDCGITSVDVAHLSEGVGKSVSLATLILKDNRIGDSGAQALGVALAATSTLTSLNLGLCGITAADTVPLAEGVRQGPPRRVLLTMYGVDLDWVAAQVGLGYTAGGLDADKVLAALNVSAQSASTAGQRWCVNSGIWHNSLSLRKFSKKSQIK